MSLVGNAGMRWNLGAEEIPSCMKSHDFYKMLSGVGKEGAYAEKVPSNDEH